MGVVLIVLGPEIDGNVSPPGMGPSGFLDETIVLDGRRWILLSSCWFCCTAHTIGSLWSLQQLGGTYLERVMLPEPRTLQS